MREYELIRKKRKNLSLIIKDGRVIVSAPLRLARQRIDEFVEAKDGWIAGKLRIQSRNAARLDNALNYSVVPLWGAEYKVVFSPLVKSICVYTGGETRELLVPERYRANLEAALKRWLKKYAHEKLLEKLSSMSGITGLSFTDFAFTNARGKWGSCDSRNKILLNWRLVMLPAELIDYVIAHELCHIKEHNHSKSFWTLVSGFVPDYKSVKKRLKEFAPLNNLYRS
jgi:predicted metal-dependent hydrolase